VDATTEGSETTEEATTDDKVDATTEGSETTEAVPDNRNTTIGHAQSATTQTLHDEPYVTDAKNLALLEVEVENVETIATNTTEGVATDDKAVETTVDTKTIEVDNGNSVAPSTITIGHARSATTRISPSETYVTDAMNLVQAVEEAVGVDHETTTDDKADEVTISAPPTVATDDKADEITEDSETTETVATDDKADEITEDSETTETVATGDKADETTEDSETTETVATDDKADETVVAKATTVQPAGVGNEMDDLSETLQTTTSVEPRGSDRAMPTTAHRVISEHHANLSEKTSERMWPRERRITLPQRP